MSIQDEDEDDADDDARLFEVFKTMISSNKSMHPSSARMDDKSFSSLSDRARKLWRDIPPEDKLIMMGATPTSRSVNSTQIDMGDDNDEESSQHEETPGSTREVNMTKVTFAPEVNQTEAKKTETKSSTHPGDIRRVLSKSASVPSSSKMNGRTSDSSARKVNNTEWQITNVNWDLSNTGPSAQPKLVDHSASENERNAAVATVNLDQANQQDGTSDETPSHDINALTTNRMRTLDLNGGYTHERVVGGQHQTLSNPQDFAMSDDEDDPIVAHWPAFDDNWDDSSSDEDF